MLRLSLDMFCASGFTEIKNGHKWKILASLILISTHYADRIYLIPNEAKLYFYLYITYQKQFYFISYWEIGIFLGILKIFAFRVWEVAWIVWVNKNYLVYMLLRKCKRLRSHRFWTRRRTISKYLLSFFLRSRCLSIHGLCQINSSMSLKNVETKQ